MTKIFGIYFVCCIGNYLDIITEQLEMIVSSGLYYKTHKILCYISLYRNDDTSLNKLMLKYSKLHLIVKEKNIYERFAINNYKKNITDFILDNEEYYLYYFHTKGVTREKDSIFTRQRQILNYYIFKNYKIAVKLLENYDCVGCSLLMYPKIHFSGNFWWSKSVYLNTLNDNISKNYLAPEMYVCSNTNGKFISLSQNTNDGDIDYHTNLSTEQIMNQITSNIDINYYDKYHLC
jgi:hypothetical protein